jgi:hydrogenase nickel incorporation protein HypA/HybF
MDIFMAYFLSRVLASHSIQICSQILNQFDVCNQGTVLEGATLEIIEIPGLARCRQCGAKVTIEESYSICDCGSMELDIIYGEELKIKEIEV